LKIGILGKNIQNAESTKKSNDNPKKILKKYSAKLSERKRNELVSYRKQSKMGH